MLRFKNGIDVSCVEQSIIRIFCGFIIHYLHYVCPKMDANLLNGFTICMFYIFLDCGFSNHATMWVCKILKTYKVSFHIILSFNVTWQSILFISFIFNIFRLFLGCSAAVPLCLLLSWSSCCCPYPLLSVKVLLLLSRSFFLLSCFCSCFLV